MGATEKESPPVSAAKKHAGGRVSLTRAGLNPNNWHVGVNPKCMGAAGKEIPPCQHGKETRWRGNFFDPGGFYAYCTPLCNYIPCGRSTQWGLVCLSTQGRFEPTNANGMRDQNTDVIGMLYDISIMFGVSMVLAEHRCLVPWNQVTEDTTWSTATCYHTIKSELYLGYSKFTKMKQNKMADFLLMPGSLGESKGCINYSLAEHWELFK